MHPILLIALVMVAQVSPTVTVSTDRGWYSPGDQVTIHISTTSMALNDTLWLYVDKPNGHNLFFTELSAGGGIVIVALPQDAPDGTYTITVAWDHRYVQTGFVVESQPIPEFPVAPLVFLVAIASAFAAISWRKASASAKTPASDTRACLVC